MQEQAVKGNRDLADARPLGDAARARQDPRDDRRGPRGSHASCQAGGRLPRRVFMSLDRAVCEDLADGRQSAVALSSLVLLGVLAFVVIDRPWAGMSSAQAARALERRLSSTRDARALG